MALGAQSSYEGVAYSHGAASGVMAAGLAANAEIYQFRWIGAAASVERARILAVYLSASVDTVTFGAAAGAGIFTLTKANAFSVAGTGGAAVTPGAATNRLRTTQVQSKLVKNGGEIRVATTAALGAGTKTLEAQPMGTLIGGCGAAALPIIYPIPLYADYQTYGIPLVLADQEGFVITANVPGTGTWKFGVSVLWAEAD